MTATITGGQDSIPPAPSSPAPAVAWRHRSGVETILVVAARELYEHLQSPLTAGLVLVCAGLAVLAVDVGIERLHDTESSVRQLQAQRDLDRAHGTLLGFQAETALRAIRPAEPLSVLASGVDGGLPEFWDFSPSGVRAGAARANAALGRIETSHPVDLEFLIRVLLGLLASALAVDSIAGQRERGELLALFGQPVHYRQILLGKVLGTVATLAVALAVTMAASLVVCLVRAPSIVTADFAWTLLLLAAASLLHCLVWIAVGFLISSAVGSYSLALTATFAIWTVSALVGLSANVMAAQAIAPVRPAQAVELDRDRLVQAATAKVQNDIGDEFAAALGGRAVWAAHQNDADLVRTARARIEPLWARHLTEVRAQLDAIDVAAQAAASRQHLLYRILTLANPAAEFSAAAANLTATGDRVTDRWTRATIEYQRMLDRILFDDRPRHYGHVPYVDPEQHVERRLVITVDRKPPPRSQDVALLQPPSRRLEQRLRDAVPHLIALGMYAAALLALAGVAFERLRL